MTRLAVLMMWTAPAVAAATTFREASLRGAQVGEGLSSLLRSSRRPQGVFGQQVPIRRPKIRVTPMRAWRTRLSLAAEIHPREPAPFPVIGTVLCEVEERECVPCCGRQWAYVNYVAAKALHVDARWCVCLLHASTPRRLVSIDSSVKVAQAAE